MVRPIRGDAASMARACLRLAIDVPAVFSRIAGAPYLTKRVMSASLIEGTPEGLPCSLRLATTFLFPTLLPRVPSLGAMQLVRETSVLADASDAVLRDKGSVRTTVRIPAAYHAEDTHVE